MVTVFSTRGARFQHPWCPPVCSTRRARKRDCAPVPDVPFKRARHDKLARPRAYAGTHSCTHARVQSCLRTDVPISLIELQRTYCGAVVKTETKGTNVGADVISEQVRQSSVPTNPFFRTGRGAVFLVRSEAPTTARQRFRTNRAAARCFARTCARTCVRTFVQTCVWTCVWIRVPTFGNELGHVRARACARMCSEECLSA